LEKTESAQFDTPLLLPVTLETMMDVLLLSELICSLHQLSDESGATRGSTM
jgi:hypothetical protein